MQWDKWSGICSERNTAGSGGTKDLVLHQKDVKSAFLSSRLAETVYLEQPEGFSSGDSQVCTTKSLWTAAGRKRLVTDAEHVPSWWKVHKKQQRLLFVLDEEKKWCNDLCAGLGRWHHHWVQMSRQNWKSEEPHYPGSCKCRSSSHLGR